MSIIKCPLQNNAESIPNETALITANACYSWKEFNHLVNNAVLNLQDLGIKKNQRIHILNTAMSEQVIVLFALWRIGATVCLLNTRLPKKIIQQQKKQMKCLDVLIPNKFNKSLGLLDAYDANVHLHQEATIMFTSGSSAEPKAVLHTYGNHYYNAKGANKNIPFKSGHRWLLSLPLYHVSGMSILFKSLLGGGAIVIPDLNNNIIDNIEKYQITHVSLVAIQLQRLLEKKGKFISLKAILLGGSAVPMSIIKKSRKKGLPIYITYGLTEMSSQVATSSRKTTDAKVLKYRKVKISSDGEIYVKGEVLFKGYLLEGQWQLPIDNQGWFATGDLGTLSPQGILNVTGRKDNMFISGGENIQPEEIEKYLYHIEGITQAVVVPQKNKEFGFRPVAFIQMNNENLTYADISKKLQKVLPKFKCPVQFYPWPEEGETAGIKTNRKYFQS